MSLTDYINEKVSFLIAASKKVATLDDVLPVKNIEADFIVMKSGRIVHGFEISSPLMERWTAEDYNLNAGIFESSFKSLNEGTVIQKIDIYYYDYQDKSKDKKFFESRYTDHFFGRPKLKHKAYLFLISPNATNIKKDEINNLNARPNTKELKKDNANLSDRIDEFGLLVDQYVQEISSIDNIGFKKINGEEFKILYNQMLNLEFRFDPGQPYHAIENKDNTLIIGSKKLNVLSLTEQAREVSNSRKNYYGVDSSFTYNLHGYYLKPHIVNTNYWIENTEKVLEKLDSEKIKSNVASEAGAEAGQVISEGLDELTKDIRTDQKRLVSMSKNMLIWGQDDGYRDRIKTEAISEVRSLGDAEMIEESYANATQFFACLPGNGAENIRYLLMPSDVAVAYQEWTTTDWPMGKGDYFADRFRNPVLVPIYNKDIDSQNGIVIGPTGSGKSYFMNHLVVQRFERGERQIIIDVGGTYKNNIEAIGGKYYKYDVENPISFNPFLITPSLSKDGAMEYKLLPEKKEFIVGVLSEIWLKNYPNQGQKSILDLWLDKYFQFETLVLNKKAPPLEHFIKVVSLNNFYYWLKDYNDKNSTDRDHLDNIKVLGEKDYLTFIVTLHPFVIGQNKNLLNNPSNLDISENLLVCFDMAGVKDSKDLYKLVTMLLVELTIDVIRRFKNDIKHFIMDEAWSMISEGSMSDFVGYMYRTIRKEKGSIFIITQGIKEIIDSKIGDVIIGQSATKVILIHTDPVKIDLLGKHLGLSEQALDKIRSLRKVPEAREFFIQQELISDVFTIEVPLEEHVLITSNPTERNHFLKLKEKHQGNVERAVEEWVIDKKINKI